MRYTTIIDISEIPDIYRNINARLLYLHMCLRAGYHDDDRDICTCSIRSLAADCGLTFSATRHALAVLARAALIEKFGNAWKVKKFLLSTPISARPRSEKKRKEQEIRERQIAEQEERERRENEDKQRLAEMRRAHGGKNGFEIMLEGLEKRAAAGDLEAAQKLKYWNKFKK